MRLKPKKVIRLLVKFYNRPGVTLIELLIVVAILGILASAVMVAVGTAHTKQARDSIRKADLKTISTALETYYFDHGFKYPPPDTGIAEVYTSDAGSEWIPNLAPFEIKLLPVDPKQVENQNRIDYFAENFNSILRQAFTSVWPIRYNVYAAGTTPVQSAYSNFQLANIGADYALGIEFDPVSDGYITQLWCIANDAGVKNVRLYSGQGLLVRSVDVICDQQWVSGDIEPYNVNNALDYTVSYWTGSCPDCGYALKQGLSLPNTTGGVELMHGLWSGNNQRPTTVNSSTLYGVDITFNSGYAPPDCDDDFDNDGDGFIDWDGPGAPDPGCDDATDNDETDAPVPSPSPSPSSSPSPSPSPSPPAGGGVPCYYSYYVSADRLTWSLWACLEYEQDPFVWNSAKATCTLDPSTLVPVPDPLPNYCISSQ